MRSSREPGKPWGKISAKHLEVFETLLWGFHNAKTGLCFPSYEAIAEKAGCARSTVYEAITALEAAELLQWVHRLKRVYERVKDMFGDGVHGQRTRVERTSNGYRFPDPPDVESSKSEDRSGTVGQESFPLSPTSPAAQAALDRAETSRQWLQEYRNRSAVQALSATTLLSRPSTMARTCSAHRASAAPISR
jgi:hypothetical protein